MSNSLLWPGHHGGAAGVPEGGCQARSRSSGGRRSQPRQEQQSRAALMGPSRRPAPQGQGNVREALGLRNHMFRSLHPVSIAKLTGQPSLIQSPVT